MVAIHPFRALRFNPDVVGDLSRVISPPYDVIGPEEQERLYQASPYNIIRLILGKQDPRDNDADNRYTRARQTYEAWCGGEVLRRDPAPALYLVEHAFSADGARHVRLGLIALLEFGDGPRPGLADSRGGPACSVFRHEATLAAPKADRTKLLEAVPANLEPIFCVFPDERRDIQALLEETVKRSAPVITATLHEQPVRVWALTEPALIERIARHLASATVLIADGHHRFEVAYAKRQQHGALMSYFASMADPALVVRPIHRVVTPEAVPSRQALEALASLEPARTLAELTGWLEQRSTEHRFGFYDGRGLSRVRLIPERIAQWLMSPTVPLPVASLDVSVLHGLVLPAETPVRYVADAAEALRAVDAGQGRSAWLLRGIPLPQVYALASQGLVLPPKSTYFYPKVPSGLTLNPLI